MGDFSDLTTQIRSARTRGTPRVSSPFSDLTNQIRASRTAADAPQEQQYLRGLAGADAARSLLEERELRPRYANISDAESGTVLQTPREQALVASDLRGDRNKILRGYADRVGADVIPEGAARFYDRVRRLAGLAADYAAAGEAGNPLVTESVAALNEPDRDIFNQLLKDIGGRVAPERGIGDTIGERFARGANVVGENFADLAAQKINDPVRRSELARREADPAAGGNSVVERGLYSAVENVPQVAGYGAAAAVGGPALAGLFGLSQIQPQAARDFREKGFSEATSLAGGTVSALVESIVEIGIGKPLQTLGLQRFSEPASMAARSAVLRAIAHFFESGTKELSDEYLQELTRIATAAGLQAVEPNVDARTKEKLLGLLNPEKFLETAIATAALSAPGAVNVAAGGARQSKKSLLGEDGARQVVASKRDAAIKLAQIENPTRRDVSQVVAPGEAWNAKERAELAAKLREIIKQQEAENADYERKLGDDGIERGAEQSDAPIVAEQRGEPVREQQPGQQSPEQTSSPSPGTGDVRQRVGTEQRIADEPTQESGRIGSERVSASTDAGLRPEQRAGEAAAATPGREILRSADESLGQESQDQKTDVAVQPQPQQGETLEEEVKGQGRPQGLLDQPADQAQSVTTAAPEQAAEPTSIKNAAVAEERKKRGFPDAKEEASRAFGSIWTTALEKSAEEVDALIGRLKESPTAIEDVHDAMLLRRQIELQDRYDDVIDELAEARRSGDPAKIADAKAVETIVAAKLLELYDVEKSVGRETARGLNARKMLAYRDFTLARMLHMKREAKGSELTSAEREQIAAMQKQIAELTEKIGTLTESNQEILELLKEARSHKNMTRAEAEAAAKDAVGEKPKRSKKAWDEFSAATAQWFKKHGGTTFSNPVEAVADLAPVVKAFVQAGFYKFQEFYAAMRKQLGEAAAAKASRAFRQAWDEVSATDDRMDYSSDNAMLPKMSEDSNLNALAHKIALFYVRSGVSTLNELVDAVYPHLRTIAPELTRDQAMDAITGYGTFAELDKEPAKVLLRELKGIGQQVGKLRDMAAGKAPKKTGVEQRTRGDEERRKIKEVNEAKKRGGFVVTDPERQLKSAQDAIKTRLENQIKDLEFQITNKRKIVKTSTPTPRTDEIKALEIRRNALKEQYDALFPKQPKTEEQRFAAWKKVKDKQIAELERRINENDFSKRTKPPEIKLTKEAKETIHRLNEVKTKFHRALANDRWKKLSVSQKSWEAMVHGSGLLRLLLVGIGDASAVGQAMFLAAGHPILLGRAFTKMVRGGLSSKEYDAHMWQLKHRDNYENNVYRRAKLAITDTHEASTARREEDFVSNLVDRIPIVAATSRAFHTLMNSLRADVFDSLYASLADKDTESSDAKAIAFAVNAFSARANLGKAEAAAGVLATTFFSPRRLASRFQVALGVPLLYGSKRAKLAIAKEYARSIAGLAVIYALIAVFKKGAGDDKEPWYEFDPRSANFGKVRFGKTWVDFLGGLSQATVLLARLGRGEYKDRYGDIIPLRGEDVKSRGRDIKSVLGDFLESKLSPILSTSLALVSQKQYSGKELTPESFGFSLLPITVQSIIESFTAEGMKLGASLSAAAFLGFGVQSQADAKPSDEHFLSVSNRAGLEPKEWGERYRRALAWVNRNKTSQEADKFVLDAIAPHADAASDDPKPDRGDRTQAAYQELLVKRSAQIARARAILKEAGASNADKMKVLRKRYKDRDTISVRMRRLNRS